MTAITPLSTSHRDPSGPAAAVAAAERIAFEIGWDHARHRLLPPSDQLHAGNPVRQGWEAARAVFGARALQATPQARQWLALRLQAWLRGAQFDRTGVTPALLRRLAVPACPVTGVALTHDTGADTDAVVQRVNPRAGYAAGNLAVFSARAASAASRAGRDWRDAAELARRIEIDGLRAVDGLTAPQWARLAALASYCTPLAHADAAALPLRVIPPPRLRALNPVQVLQLLLTQRFMRQGQPARVDRIAALFPPALRTPVAVLMTTLLSRRIAAGPSWAPALVQRAMEQAWAEEVVLRRWQALAGALTAAQCERIVERMVALRLAHPGWRCLPAAQATEGWALETGGRAIPDDDDALRLPATDRAALAA